MYAPASTPCSDQSCAGGVVTSYSACDGMGNCEGNESMSTCPNNLGCQGTGCAMVCGTNDSNGDALCATGYWCNGLMCLQLLPPSSPCSRGTQCTSGNCSGNMCQ
jgi:hypothetical protein